MKTTRIEWTESERTVRDHEPTLIFIDREPVKRKKGPQFSLGLTRAKGTEPTKRTHDRAARTALRRQKNRLSIRPHFKP